MRIARRNLPWAIFCVSALSLGLVARLAEQTLIDGIAASIAMVFAAMLGLRKKWLRLRLGPVAQWTSAHNWLGLLVLGFTLLHSGFSLGGPLTTALMLCLGISAVSGAAGAIIQYALPSIMTSRLPDESAREDLGPIFDKYRVSIEELVKESKEAALESFHRDTLSTFLASPRSNATVLSNDAGATLAFDALRSQVGRSAHEIVDQIQAICTEARHRADELMLLRWLRAWELVHIPISMTALVLLLAHGFSALWY